MSGPRETREWAENSANVCLGCRHGCLYCYAAEIAARFGRRARDGWSDSERVNRAAVESLKGRRFGGRVMFPATHDITPGNWEACLQALGYLLAAHNDVLVVTKGGEAVVNLVGMEMHDAGLQRDGCRWPKPEMRFSITCEDDRIREFWEPGAPTIGERFGGLKWACHWGMPTSVSVEPLLEPHAAVEMVSGLETFCRSDAHGRGGEIWIGKARQLKRRTAWARGRVTGLDRAVRHLEAEQADDVVMGVYEKLKDHPKVRWKDSYAAVIRRHGGEI